MGEMELEQCTMYLVTSLSGIGSRGCSGQTTHDVAPENRAPGGMQLRWNALGQLKVSSRGNEGEIREEETSEKKIR